jgi:hypothetical protein
MLTKKLEEIGLNDKEAKVYIATIERDSVESERKITKKQEVKKEKKKKGLNHVSTLIRWRHFINEVVAMAPARASGATTANAKNRNGKSS